MADFYMSELQDVAMKNRMNDEDFKKFVEALKKSGHNVYEGLRPEGKEARYSLRIQDTPPREEYDITVGDAVIDNEGPKTEQLSPKEAALIRYLRQKKDNKQSRYPKGHGDDYIDIVRRDDRPTVEFGEPRIISEGNEFDLDVGDVSLVDENSNFGEPIQPSYSAVDDKKGTYTVQEIENMAEEEKMHPGKIMRRLQSQGYDIVDEKGNKQDRYYGNKDFTPGFLEQIGNLFGD